MKWIKRKGPTAMSFATLGFLGLLSSPSSSETDVKPLPHAATRQVDFRKHIRPLLQEKCHSCHGPERQLSGLRLDNHADALKGGYSGVVIKPGRSGDSKLIHMVAGLLKGLTMPMGGDPLTPDEVGLLRAWIDQGAVWTSESAQASTGAGTSRPQVKHWAFSPPLRSKVPKVRNRVWLRNPIDAFVVARLEKEAITPAPEADPETLIRRLSLDLIGLPPTPEQVDLFLADKRTDAYERLVDRLLDSPHYGEKWARQWLDLAHYADSEGYSDDTDRPYAWRWRDWVIDALNHNLPFDLFTIEQIAGDLLPDATIDQKVATGFFRNTLTNREGGIDLEEFRVEQAVDRTSTLGTTWLGLTVGCARCHDHKYDPISQKEFYQLYAFFNRVAEQNLEAPLDGERGPYFRGRPDYERKRKALLAEFKVEQLQTIWESKLQDASKHPGADGDGDFQWGLLGVKTDGALEIFKIDPARRTAGQRKTLTDHFIRWNGFTELKTRLEQLEEEYPELTKAQTLVENPNPPKTHVLVRGSHRQPGVEVQPNIPAFLNALPENVKPTRLMLAQWLVSKNNPLTARVAVNRMWQEFFGRGLVQTSQDFGLRGDPPTHPELLDWLATEFVENGWNMKKMHKLIVESATYRQSSKARAELQLRDPDNKLLARQVRLRLTAELIRDATLAASGLLNPAIGGKSFRPNENRKNPNMDFYRRGLYVFFKRSSPLPELMAFDAPDSLNACSRRERSTTPLQALTMLNAPLSSEAAQGLAARVLGEDQAEVRDRMRLAFRLCLCRTPTPSELDRLLRYYNQSLERDPETVRTLYPGISQLGLDATEIAAWVGICGVLLNLDEFITRE